MASSLANPFRRFVHSTSCARVVASSAHMSPTASQRPGETDQSGGAGRGVFNQLNAFMDTVINEPHDFEDEPVDPTVVAFTEGRLIRPVDLHRDLHKQLPLRRRRANIGPGREARYNDIFLQLGIDPRHEADNSVLMGNFMTHLGRIQPRNATGLSQRSQRLIGKAIKRAKMMGVMPILSKAKVKDLTSGSGSHNSRASNSERKDERKGRSNFSG